MADVSARTPVFSRGSGVLEYWLVHAEGLTVEPLGARVEEVVVAAPAGRAEALIVRSRMTRRRRSIPAESIAAVEPSRGQLLLDTPAASHAPVRIPRPSPQRVAAARAGATRRAQVVRTHATGAARSLGTGTRTTASWVRPRAARAGLATLERSRNAAARTAQGISWAAPRVAAAARVAAVATAQWTYVGALLVARGGALVARRLEHALAGALERGSRAQAERRARRRLP